MYIVVEPDKKTASVLLKLTLALEVMEYASIWRCSRDNSSGLFNKQTTSSAYRRNFTGARVRQVNEDFIGDGNGNPFKQGSDWIRRSSSSNARLNKIGLMRSPCLRPRCCKTIRIGNH